jgi:hypothetical protein
MSTAERQADGIQQSGSRASVQGPDRLLAGLRMACSITRTEPHRTAHCAPMCGCTTRTKPHTCLRTCAVVRCAHGRDGREKTRRWCLRHGSNQFAADTSTDVSAITIPQAAAQDSARLANLRHGSNRFTVETSTDVSTLTIPQAAALVGVGEASIGRAQQRCRP